MHEDLRQRIAKEYRYAVTKMQEVKQPARKLFYFSVFFSEAQRILNWEWDKDLTLIYAVTYHVHTQLNAAMQHFASGVLPIDWVTIYDKLTQIASDLATHFEKAEHDDNREELCQILGNLTEIAYTGTGNGSYLHEKGAFKL